MFFDSKESELREHLLLEAHVNSSDRVMQTGLTGESVFDVKRTLARSPRILQRDENKGIHVHKGSRFTSTQFLSALTGNKKVPFLGDLPLLGHFFRTDSKDRSKQNLLVFITPTIVQDEDFQPTKTDFLKTKLPAHDAVDKDPGPWDSGKPAKWSKP